MKDKIKLVEKHIEMYLVAKVKIESTISGIHLKPHVVDHYKYVHYAINQLEEELRLIIFNDFMAKNKRNWYLEYFSTSSYYRLRKVAIEKFLNCLEGL